MKLDPTYFKTLKKLYRLTQGIESEIYSFQPEVVLFLARGGVGPLWAVQARWEETHQEHPPVVMTNLGREKISRYEYHRMAIGQNFMAGIEPFDDFYGPGEKGYFLTWLAKQADWRNELRQQVQQVLGSGHPPARILVVDDTVHQGYTTLVALGLLLAEFPQSETRMLTGDLPNWRPDLAAPWINEHAGQFSHRSQREINDYVYNFAPGIGEPDKSSLRWEPLHPGSVAWQNSRPDLLADEWLELSPWIKNQVVSYVKKSIKNRDEQVEAGEEIQRVVLRPKLSEEELAFRQRWQSADLTPQEVSRELGISIEDAKKLLVNLLAESRRTAC